MDLQKNLALDLGYRRSELTGLIWNDVDLKTDRVQINKITHYAYQEIYEE